ncbi:unnamed protein product, partial [Nesidiocoris tenuis]
MGRKVDRRGAEMVDKVEKRVDKVAVEEGWQWRKGGSVDKVGYRGRVKNSAQVVGEPPRHVFLTVEPHGRSVLSICSPYQSDVS